MGEALLLTALGLSACGAAAGMLGAVMGVGGGIVLVPAMVLVFGFPMSQAVGTGLAAVIATSSAVASVNVQRGLANIRLGMVLEIATVAGALAGAAGASFVPERLLVALFGLILGGLFAAMWRERAEGADAASSSGPLGPLDAEYDDPRAGRVSYRVRRLPVGLGVSAAAGALSGLLGVGGGFLKIPVLHLYCGMPMKAAAATGNFMLGVTAAASAAVYFRRGDIRPLPAALVVLGVLAGSMLGARLSPRLKDHAVRRGFALLLAFLSVRMLLRAYHG